MSASNRAHRGTIHLEEAEIIEQAAHPGEQFILRVRAPECARTAVAGSFAHIRCDADIPMRRPISIMRADPVTGQVDFLYKIVGSGLRALSTKKPGDAISIMGPIGNGFSANDSKPRKLMVGGGVGVPPMLFLAAQLASCGTDLSGSLVLMGSEVPFPFNVVKSKLQANGIAADATHALAELETLGIPSRLASLRDYAGVHTGYVTALASGWLNALPSAEREQVEMFACGPEPMLEAVAAVAAEFDVACQLSLEEFMACAVGGCAGCTVPVHEADGIAMRRVCVDGPVFAAESIYPAA